MHESPALPNKRPFSGERKTLSELAMEKDAFADRLEELKLAHRTLKSEKIKRALSKALILSLSQPQACVLVNEKGFAEILDSLPESENALHCRFRGNCDKPLMEKLSIRLKKSAVVEESLAALQTRFERLKRECQRSFLECEQAIEEEKFRLEKEARLQEEENRQEAERSRKQTMSSLVEAYKLAMKIENKDMREKRLEEIRLETSRHFDKSAK